MIEVDPLIEASNLARERYAQSKGHSSYANYLAKMEAERQRIAREEAERAAAAKAKIDAVELEQAKADGFATVAEWKADQQRRQDELLRQRREAERQHEAARMIRAAGLPQRQLDAICTGAELADSQEAIAAAILPMLEEGAIVALIGPRGTGKTHTACKLTIRYVKNTLLGARYIKALDYFLAIKDSWARESSKTERAVVESFAGAALLVIDEAHERGGSEWELTRLTDLLDRRYAARRPTLLLANLTKQALAESLGTSICSRLREDGDVFELAGQSFRELIRADRLSGARPAPHAPPALPASQPMPFREDK
jgi:DNA replication protein DnaC